MKTLNDFEIKEEDFEEVNNFEFWNPEEPGDQILGVFIDSFKGDFGTTFVLEVKGYGRVALPAHKGIQDGLRKAIVGELYHIKLKEIKQLQSKNEEGEHKTFNVYSVRRHKASKPVPKGTISEEKAEEILEEVDL